MSSSSSASSANLLASSSSSSEEEEEVGFTFNGQTYPTYQEMVEAKRERNRKVLQKSVDEISTAMGSGFNKDSNKSSGNNGNEKKRKRRGSNNDSGGDGSTQKPKRVRRNPSRAARSTTSSISSQSHISSSCQSLSTAAKKKKRKRIATRLNIPIPAIPDGQTEIILPCPEIGPGWTMRVRARKKVAPPKKPGPVSDRVFLSPTGRILRSLNDVDRFLEGESVVSTIYETDGNTIESATADGGASSVCSTSPSLPTSVNLQEEPPAQFSVAMPADQSLIPKSIMVKDMCASLEHILMNGGRVQARENIWRDFMASDPILSSDHIKGKTSSTTKKNNHNRKDEGVGVDEANGSGEKDKLIHLGDWKLYNPIIAHGENNAKLKGDDNKLKTVASGSMKCKSFMEDDDDMVIPDEFLAPSETKGGPDPDASTNHPNEQHHTSILQGTLPLNNPAKYNNMVREQHSYYTTQGPDCYWDEEFGDGIDPMMFVEECCKRSGKTTASIGDRIDSGSTCGITRHSELEIDAMAKSHTASLLQRCWDRAVHAASSTVTVSADAGNQRESEATSGANLKSAGIDISVLQNQSVAESILQSEAMNVVDGILDTLFVDGKGNGNLRDMLGGLQAENQRVDWRHVMKSLQSAASLQKSAAKGEKGKEEQCSMPLDHISLKSLSMRLVERYGSGDHRMPL